MTTNEQPTELGDAPSRDDDAPSPEHARDREGRPRSPKAERTREQLLDAAAKVIATKGYEIATLRAIADEAGFTIGALQGHFPSKLDLAEAAARRGLIGSVPDSGDPDAALNHIGRAANPDPAWTHLRKLNLAMCTTAPNNPEIGAVMRELIKERAERLRASIEAGIEAGTIRDDLDVETLTVVIAAIYGGLGCREAVSYPLPPPDRLVELFATLLRPPEPTTTGASPD